MTEQSVTQMLDHMRLGVAWPEDYETVKALIAKLNGLELLNERDQLREQVKMLRSEGNPFMTSED